MAKRERPRSPLPKGVKRSLRERKTEAKGPEKEAPKPMDVMAEFKAMSIKDHKLPYLADNLDDRSVVIMATSLLDEQLKFSITCLFRVTPLSRDMKEIFRGPTAPLGTFSAKIALCGMLGIVVGEMRHDFDILREIRNDFAHTPFPVSFDDEGVAKECAKLKLKHPIREKFTSPAKQRFCESCVQIGGMMTILIARAQAERLLLKQHADEIARRGKEMLVDGVAARPGAKRPPE